MWRQTARWCASSPTCAPGGLAPSACARAMWSNCLLEPPPARAHSPAICCAWNRRRMGRDEPLLAPPLPDRSRPTNPRLCAPNLLVRSLLFPSHVILLLPGRGMAADLILFSIEE